MENEFLVLFVLHVFCFGLFLESMGCLVQGVYFMSFYKRRGFRAKWVFCSYDARFHLFLWWLKLEIYLGGGGQKKSVSQVSNCVWKSKNNVKELVVNA